LGLHRVGEQTITHSGEETIAFGKTLVSRLQPGSIIALVGPLGAGKTTLVQGFGAGLEVREAITSPAFNYLFEYSGRLPLYHADLYRIESAREFLALGLDEYFDRGGVFVIEWAERIADILPPSTVTIYLRPLAEGNAREITVRQGPPDASR
jgi:tRNA threonylcarbamoyladenosine biosynthesis protein TsaE